MSEITVNRIVAVPIEKVWSIVSDIGGVHRFHPYVEHSPLLSEASTGLGSSRRCEFYDGKHVVEEVSAWEEGRSLTVDIVSGSMPLAKAQATIRLAERDGGQTEVTMRMRYRPKYGPIGAMMDVVMMRRMFRKLLGQVLEGLDHHGQTGILIGPNGIPDSASVPPSTSRVSGV